MVGSLLGELSLVKGMSFRSGIPYVGVNHLEAHLLTIHLEHEVSFPYIALLASGVGGFVVVSIVTGSPFVLVLIGWGVWHARRTFSAL